DLALAAQHPDHLLLRIEGGDYRSGAGAELVELAAIEHATVKRRPGSELRQQGQQAVYRSLRMPGRRIVDGDVQREVIRIDVELVELIGRDQQMERQLLIAQIEADDLGQEIIGMIGQRSEE